MNLTPQDLWTLRNIVVRTVNECHEVLAAAARSAQGDRRKQEARGRQGGERPAARVGASGTAQGDLGKTVSSPAPVHKLTYTVKEAAAALGISRSTVWKHRFEGRLQVFRLGGRVLIKAETLHAFIAEAERG